jgi:hypothetical protein
MKARVLPALILSLVIGRQLFCQSTDIFKMSAEERAAFFAKIGRESEEQWKQMIQLLKVPVPSVLPVPANDPGRPAGTFQKKGSSNWTDSAGNTYARSAWGTWNNYDEAVASPYRALPDPLRTTDGRTVSDAKTWWEIRRPEIESQFEEEVFGKVPDQTPVVRWRLAAKADSTIGSHPVVVRHLLGIVDNSSDPNIEVHIMLTVTTPADADRAVPVILEFGFNFPPGFVFPGLPPNKGPTWQEQVVEKGWGYATYDPTSVQPDNGAGLTRGIIGLVNHGQPRRPDEWGALRAWAWGASRIMDFFETDTTIDSRKIGIEGVSRYGKAVLVTMAFDQRFAVAIAGSSGKGGAALYRRNYGESMWNICSSGEFHWFAGNLLKYVTNTENLPVDSHELIALCAPRPVFISCGSPQIEGRWVDDTGQFMAAVAAGSVYRLAGAGDLGTSTMPPIGTSLAGGALAFRQHEDGHAIGPNWPYCIQFVEDQFAQRPSSRTR